MTKSTKPIYVIGHRNPDTDSICSAIGYAHLKQALGSMPYRRALARSMRRRSTRSSTSMSSSPAALGSLSARQGCHARLQIVVKQHDTLRHPAKSCAAMTSSRCRSRTARASSSASSRYPTSRALLPGTQHAGSLGDARALSRHHRSDGQRSPRLGR